jgi:predicted Zn finger-like uncharacterized protein
MLVGCPECKTRYRVDASRIAVAGSILRCSRCRGVFRVAKASPSTVSVNLSPAGTPAHADRKISVLVAHESPDFCSAVAQVLAAEPFVVINRHDGREALTVVEELLPDVVLLDVALPGMYGFEICDHIRVTPALSSVKTILIASIYDKTRYKREPQSLYGADDYIEKHHVPDSLAAKIYCLVLGQQHLDSAGTGELLNEEEQKTDMPDMSPVELEDQERVRQEIRRDEQRKTTCDSDVERDAAHEKARRLARIIVADIALYNQRRVERAIAGGTFYDQFAEEIQEGQRLYDQRVPADVRQGTDYLENAIADFMSLKQAELSMPDAK